MINEFWIKVNYPHVGPGSVGGVSSLGVFLRDPSPYLREFRRKPRKTPKCNINKCDRGLNLAPPVYQFGTQNRKPLVGPPQKYSDTLRNIVGNWGKRISSHFMYIFNTFKYKASYHA